MNPSEITAWFERAFLHVEGSLLQKSAHSSPAQITEEFVRSSLVDGLKYAKSTYAANVDSEVDAPWNGNPDINVATRKFGQGRPKQHDAAITINNLVAAAEVKWLKNNKSDDVAQDIWKLLFSHSTATPASTACRTFLLVGGEKNAFQSTINSLRSRHGLHFRWSPQGKAQSWPKPFFINVGAFANNLHGQDCLKQVLCRSASQNSPYNRKPPDVWWKYRVQVVSRGWRTIENYSWKIALWEIDHKNISCGADTVDWSPLSPLFP